MNNTGIARPGAKLMIFAAALMILGTTVPWLLASSSPSHLWFLELTGLPALGLVMGHAVLILMYFLGYLAYVGSKGYSKWLGFCLFFASVPGFVVMLLLPDRAETRVSGHDLPEAYPQKEVRV